MMNQCKGRARLNPVCVWGGGGGMGFGGGLAQGKGAIHCKENPLSIFLFWEQRGLSPNANMSVSDLYIPRIGLHISSSRIGRPMVGMYRSLTET